MGQFSCAALYIAPTATYSGVDCCFGSDVVANLNLGKLAAGVTIRYAGGSEVWAPAPRQVQHRQQRRRYFGTVAPAVLQALHLLPAQHTGNFLCLAISRIPKLYRLPAHGVCCDLTWACWSGAAWEC